MDGESRGIDDSRDVNIFGACLENRCFVHGPSGFLKIRDRQCHLKTATTFDARYMGLFSPYNKFHSQSLQS